MTNKERVHAVLEGRPVDRLPVHASYAHLYHEDHFAELTGQPQSHIHKWLYAPRDEFLNIFRQIHEAAPFDIIQPPSAPAESFRQHTKFVEKDGQPFLHDQKNDNWIPLKPTSRQNYASGDYQANQKQLVFDKKDINERVYIVPAEQQIREGHVQRRRDIVETLGQTEFVMTGGMAGPIWCSSEYVGQINALRMLLEQPDLMMYLCQRLTERNIELIRLLAAAGGDAIFVDDAMSTSEIISVELYEKFSLPFIKQLVAEIHRLGHKAIVIYFGGVMDRLDQIASIGADGFAMEASMKSYVNDIDEIAERIGQKVTLFGNINPYTHIERMSDRDLKAEMKRQAKAGRKARGFIMAAASPLTPGTPLSRIRKFIEIGRRS